MATTRRHAGDDGASESGRSALRDLVVITGYSGAGKSTAMNVFEDAGYFCVDNLPPEMIRGLADLFMHAGSNVERAAVVSDVRGGSYFEALDDVLDALAASVKPRVLFLDASPDALLTRYKETRRRHPMAPESSIVSGIEAETAVLGTLKERADLVIDTTHIKAADLRRRITEQMLPRKGPQRLAVTFESFGFKHGPPRDADLSFDVRFLPNPHYIEELQPLTGKDQEVVDYVGRGGKLDEFYAKLIPLLDFVLPEYEREGKAHLVVAIGCTGGRHRSVAIAEELARRYRDREDLYVEVTHRDAHYWT